jgi:hypothetical protein
MASTTPLRWPSRRSGWRWARGANASSEAADVVLTTDRLDRLADAMEIACRARRIAVQSALAGRAMSLAAMAVAAFGLLPPAFGALLQEGIDVAVILNALRALRGGQVGGRSVPENNAGLAASLRGRARPPARGAPAAAHGRVHAGRRAGPLGHRGAASGLRRAGGAAGAPRGGQGDGASPALARTFGSGEAVAPMSRAHAEIGRLTRRLETHLDAIDHGAELDSERRQDVLACLYGLHALLELHFVQEEESYFTLVAE